MKAIINARIYDYRNYYENYYVIFDDKIQEIGTMSNFSKLNITEIIDAKNGFLLPGFVNSHAHLYSAFARGMNVDFHPNNFQEILEQLWWKLDHFLDKDMLYYSAFSSGLEQIKKGTTSLIDHHASYTITDTLNTIKKALIEDLGIRAVLAFETSDRFDIDNAIKENKDFIESNHTEKVAGLFGLHASFTLSKKTLDKVKANLFNAGIHIHIAESLDDELDAMNEYKQSVVERLDSYGLINEKSNLIHLTNASEEELEIIKARNAFLTINITSNMNNAVGLPDLHLMEELDINYMIGNDGLIQSMPIEYLNAYYTAHLKTNNPVGFSLAGIKKAIINSQKYVSKLLNINLGEIKPGFVSDFIIVPYDEFTPINESNIFEHVFFGVFPGLLPRYVIANGKLIIKDYQESKRFKEINQESLKQAKKLWNIIEKEGKNIEFKN